MQGKVAVGETCSFLSFHHLPTMFILFTKTQLSLTIPGQVLTVFDCQAWVGFKGGNKKESVGLTLPEGTVFESVDSKQEVAV